MLNANVLAIKDLLLEQAEAATRTETGLQAVFVALCVGIFFLIVRTLWRPV